MKIKSLPTRGRAKRLFRSRLKIDFPGSVSHITQRALGKEILFKEDTDYIYMLGLLRSAVEKFQIDILSFCLMPSDIHVLVKLNNNSLSSSMKMVFGTYATYFNKKYSRKGHVFCGAFRQAVCFDDSYVLAASIYIHLNPKRAGLVKDPASFKWSSCGLYLNSARIESFVEQNFILNILNQEESKAKEDYQRLVGLAGEVKISETYEDKYALDCFRAKIIDLAQDMDSLRNSETWDLLNDQVLNKQIEELRLKGKLRTLEQKKACRYLIEQLRTRGYNISQIAKKLSFSRMGIYKILWT
jgi:putative transposase